MLQFSVDINECFQGALTGISPCDSSMLCTNMPGTFMCSCPFGTFNDNGVCMEISKQFLYVVQEEIEITF